MLVGTQDVVVYCAESPDFDTNVRDNAGYTPLHEACNRGHLDIAQVGRAFVMVLLFSLICNVNGNCTWASKRHFHFIR